MGIAWKSLGTGRIGMISTYTSEYGCNARFLDIPLGQHLLDWCLLFFLKNWGGGGGYLALVISLYSLGKSAEAMPSKLFHKRSLQLENLPIHNTLRPRPTPPSTQPFPSAHLPCPSNSSFPTTLLLPPPHTPLTLTTSHPPIIPLLNQPTPEFQRHKLELVLEKSYLSITLPTIPGLGWRSVDRILIIIAIDR